MRRQPSRLTVQCPVCGEQLVIQIRFPVPEHHGFKEPEVLRFFCSPNCMINEAQVREALNL